MLENKTTFNSFRNKFAIKFSFFLY